MNKILLLHDKLWQDSTKALIQSYDHIDLILYDSLDELPQNFGSEIYSGLFILSTKINIELCNYVKKLRANNNRQIVFILGSAVSKEIVNEIAKIGSCLIFEKSGFIEEQLNLLFKQITEYSLLQKKLDLNNIQLEQLVVNSPENIITIDIEGRIVAVNKSFKNEFLYAENKILNTNLEYYLPDYSYNEIISTLHKSPKKKSVRNHLTTFINGAGQLIPIELSFSSSQTSDNDYHIYINDRSELLTNKRILDFQNRCFSDLSLLLNNLLREDEAPWDNPHFFDQLIKIFSCDEIIRCRTKQSKSKHKLEIDMDTATDDEKEILYLFKDPAEKEMKKSGIHIVHIDPVENAMEQNDAQTAVLIPVETIFTKEFIILFYANHFEPDEFITDLFNILAKIVSYKMQQKEIINRQETESKKLKEIIENAVDGIYRSTIEGRLIYANSTFIKMLGYRNFEELENLKIDSDIYVDTKEREKFIERVTKEKRIQNIIINLKSKTGKLITVLDHAHLIEFEDTKYIEGILRDISENKLLEERLKNSRMFANELIDKASIIITVQTGDNFYLVWNKKAEQVTGYSEQEIVGNPDVASLLYPDEKYRDFVQRKFDEHLNENESSPIELKLQTKGGKEKTISWTAVKLPVDTVTTHTVTFGIDITEMRHLEKRFSETKQMDVFNTFTDKIAQQYKQLINLLSSSFDNLKEQSPAIAEEAFKKADEYLRQAHQFSDQILNLSGRQLAKSNEVVDPDEIIEHSIHILKNTIPSNITIDAELNSRGFVNVTEAQFNQILLNLALNSVAALPDGGTIFITSRVCETKNEHFLIRNNAVNPRYLKVVFKDSGMGMDENIRSRIFEPFFTTSDDKIHKGLGATLIFNIIRSANGFISASSEPGNGTSITFYLPFVNEKKDKQRATPAANSKILIVDDQKVIREFLNDMANTDGYTTILAADGLEGLQIFEKRHKEIGLAILDIIMPKMYGNELFYRMREINPEIKVLITSGHTDSKIKKQLIKDGVDGFLPKPFDVQSARDQIRSLLS